jgi:hypothetical protein
MVIVSSTRKRDVRDLKKSTIFEQSLQLTTKVRYLVLVLDKGLTWKAQMKSVLNIRPTGLSGSQRTHLGKLGV